MTSTWYDTPKLGGGRDGPLSVEQHTGRGGNEYLRWVIGPSIANLPKGHSSKLHGANTLPLRDRHVQ